MRHSLTHLHIEVLIGLAAVIAMASPGLAMPLTFSYEGTINKIKGKATQRPFFNVLKGERLRFTYTFDSNTVDVLPTSRTAGLFPGAISHYSVDLGSTTFSGTTGTIVVDKEGLAFGTYTVFDLLSLTGPLFQGFQASSIIGLLDDFSGTVFSDDSLPVIQPDPQAFNRSSISLEFLHPQTGEAIEIIAKNNIQIDADGDNAVPEPSTLFLLGSGLWVFAVWSHRQHIFT